MYNITNKNRKITNLPFETEGEHSTLKVSFGPLWCEIKIKRVNSRNWIGKCHYKWTIISNLSFDSKCCNFKLAKGYSSMMKDAEQVSKSILQKYLDDIDYHSLSYYFDNTVVKTASIK